MSMPRYAQDAIQNQGQGGGGGVPWGKFGAASAMGGLGAGLGALLMGGGNKDNSDQYFNQIPDVLKQYFQPYVEQGLHPGETLNQIGGQYKQSPGFNFALQQALQGGQHAAAAGGMAGSPQAQQQQMQLASDIASQDYNNWMNQALGLQSRGQQAGMGLGENLASNLGQRGMFDYMKNANENQANSAMWQNMFSGAAQMLPFLLA